jgi:hypothetical protein
MEPDQPDGMAVGRKEVATVLSSRQNRAEKPTTLFQILERLLPQISRITKGPYGTNTGMCRRCAGISFDLTALFSMDPNTCEREVRLCKLKGPLRETCHLCCFFTAV